MAEGLTRLNQQVVEPEHWTRAARLRVVDGRPMSAAPTKAERERRRDDVRRAVEADIVPRVLLDRDRGSAPAPAAQGAVVEQHEVAHFVRLLLDHAADDRPAAYTLAVQARGVTLADIYLTLFQPAARRIGDLWAEDRCSFVDVTLAIGTMHRMLRFFEPIFQADARLAAGDRQALLVPLPGDQHTFGLSMVTEFFRRAGWSVWNMPLATFDDLAAAVKTAWFAVVGFSASTDSRLDELAAAIRLVRLQSCNRAVGVMVGGPIFVERPDYVARVGADAFGRDADEALVRAEGFLAPAAGT